VNRLTVPACETTDYFFENSDCVDGTYIKTPRWIEPLLCNTTHPNSVTLPDPSDEPCGNNDYC
jgi:hypothetical protein